MTVDQEDTAGAVTSGTVQWEPWCHVHETHSGAVLLLGDLAYKFKKPVALGFLDFREPAARRAVCADEVRLNRRLAPDVYLGVGSLTAPDGAQEPVVVMRRLPDSARLSHLVRSGRITLPDIDRIAERVADFHARAASGPAVHVAGTRDALRGRWDANLARAAAAHRPFVGVDRLDAIAVLAHRYLEGRRDLFDRRIADGAVVDGHGDLTPDDVFCLPDGPRLLDCLEFDPQLRHVDRLDDVAFLAMGLEDLGARDAAARLVATWSDRLDDDAPASLLHHYVAYRAIVRAMVGCLRGAQLHDTAAQEVVRHLDLARDHLRASEVRLVLVGGPPGSGKSTLSAAVARRLGMRLLSSDRIRKELAGIDPFTSAAASFGTGIYDASHTRATYAAMLGRAQRHLANGESVVLDASWTDVRERAAARAVADRSWATLVQLRCDVDPATADERIRTRHCESDADPQIAEALRRAADRWPAASPVDTAQALERSVAEACRLIGPTTV